MKAAMYARFSTDRQSESSIEDQFRVSAERCVKEGFAIVARFEDQGISGAAIGNRPGFKAMLESALAGRFDVLLVMDLSRLSRSQADLPKTIDRLTARGIRIIGVQDGYDSARKGHKLQAGLSGIIGEAFREMVSDRTYAALESRALQGKPAGGKRYGYGPGEAEVVLQIFRWYADGLSAPWIAAELNRRKIPSPGAAWRRTTRRRGGWHPSAIAGDPKRGIGVLNNPRYIGETVWNRSQWVKDPDTGKRRCVQRPKAQWITTTDEADRIIPQELWDKVKSRQAERSREVGARIAQGLKSNGVKAPRYLFSGLLKCERCGSSFVMADTRSYQCSGYVNGRACTNPHRVAREVLEARLIDGIRTRLLSDDSIEEFKKRIRKALLRRPADPNVKRRRALESEVENIASAIGKGLLSPTLAKRLQAAEAELATLPPPSTTIVKAEDVISRLPDAVRRFRRMAADLGNAPIDMEKARSELRRLLGQVWIAPRKDHLVARIGLEIQPLPALACSCGSGGRI